MRSYLTTLLILVLFNSCPSANAQQPLLEGIATIIDGDTIKIKKKRIRLHGIDAPESRQNCKKNKIFYSCGQQATLALSKKIYKRAIQCEQRAIDRYRRVVAVCKLGSIDLNRWMVRQGWALAYRKYSLDYVYEETVAKNAKAGIWAGFFVEPSRWRRGERLIDQNLLAQKNSRCRIKGNISRRGKLIYHLPGGKYYTQTKIDGSKGERWFCSEEEARKKGWRRSRQ
jgi:endonuclease YncB( thermonuclease family)